jgi:hypothetical protein
VRVLVLLRGQQHRDVHHRDDFVRVVHDRDRAWVKEKQHKTQNTKHQPSGVLFEPTRSFNVSSFTPTKTARSRRHVVIWKANETPHKHWKYTLA